MEDGELKISGVDVMPRRALAIGLLAAAITLFAPAGTPSVGPGMASAGTPAPGFQESVVWSGLTAPTVVRFASDGRVFVAEKSGLIKVFDSLTDQSPTTFADLRTKVFNYWDRGLLGMALHPAFPATPYVYVLYSYDHVLGDPAAPPRWGTAGATSDNCPTPPGPTTDGCVTSGRISRLQASGNVMTGSEQVLVENFCNQFQTHSVGTLEFGPDGMLYASAGEGANADVPDYGQMGSPKNPCGDPPGGVGSTLTPPTAEGGALRSQDLRTSGDPVTLDGTIIRIDPTTGAAPPTNPLAGNGDPNAKRIISHGLRNPFRFDFRTGTSELWVGDVGWNTTEEINRISSPTDATVENFGWPCYEGGARQPGYDALDLTICEGLYAAPAATGPFFAYAHDDDIVNGEPCPFSPGSSISGLAFEPNATAYPAAYRRALYFADYSRSCIWVMKTDATGIPAPGLVETFVTGASGPVNLEFSPTGELYYVDINQGTIRRIGYTQAPGPPPSGTSYVSDLTWTSMTNGWGPAEKDMSNGESNAGDGRTLTLNGVTYAKGLGVHAPSDIRYNVGGSCSRFKAEVGIDDEVPGTAGTVVFQVFAGATKVYDSGVMTAATATKSVDVSITGASELRLVVTNGGDNFNADHGDWALARVECGGAGNQPPVPTISTPSSTTTWRVGDAIAFSGSAMDPQDGALPASGLSWDLILQHCPSTCHSHPIQSWPGVASGSFNAPDHGYPAYLDLRLTATDSGGASASTTLRLDPATVVLTFASNPAGLQLAVNSAAAAAPFSRTVIVGSSNSMTAISPQTLGGTSYAFQSWSDAGAQTHTIVAPASPTTFTATYAPGGAASCPAGEYTAQYFSNLTLSAPAALTRCEAAPLNQNWGSGGPGSPVPTDNFSARWTGQFSFTGGDYTFTASADDGIRVWVDGTILIDQWIDQATTTYTATRNLSAGTHEVKVEYYEKGGGAVATLSWAPSSPAGCTGGQYYAEYFSNITLTAPAVLSRCETAPLNNDWGAGGPGSPVPVNNFSARWTGQFTFAGGDYTFTASADDGIRVWVDGTILIDQWIDQATTTYTATRNLSAGTHEVKVEYYEKGGQAVAKLSWAP